MSRPAVLVIDMVNDCVTGVFGSPRYEAVVPRIATLLEGCRADGIPIIFCSDSHLKGVDVELTVHADHALRGTWGAEIVTELRPRPTDFSLTKRRYSAFFGTELEPLLRELGSDTVILTGVATNGCVKHAAADAFYLGFKLLVVADCVENKDEEGQAQGIEQMVRSYGARAVLAAEVGAAI